MFEALKKNTEIFIQWVWHEANTSAFVKRKKKKQLPSWFIWRTRIEKQQLYNNKLGEGHPKTSNPNDHVKIIGLS